MKKFLDKAELILVMFDTNTTLSEEDMKVIREIKREKREIKSYNY